MTKKSFLEKKVGTVYNEKINYVGGKLLWKRQKNIHIQNMKR